MNNWPYEFTAQYNRQRILEEVNQIRLERLAEKSRRGHPGIFGRVVLHLGYWMISTGERLHDRYQAYNDIGRGAQNFGGDFHGPFRMGDD